MRLKLLVGALAFSCGIANAQLSTINENFEGFTTGTTATWPQNNWSKFISGSSPWIYADGTASNKYIQYYSFMTPNGAGYLITPQIVAPDGTKTLSFKAAITTGSASGTTGTIQIGLMDNTTDISTFTNVGSAVTLTGTEETYTVTIPASSKQYIAFKIIGSAAHTAIQVDDIQYNLGTLAVTDFNKSNNDLKFVVNENSGKIEFYGKKNVKNVEIFSANGQKLEIGKIKNNQISVATLSTGVYYMLIQDENGKTTKSKFIKK